MLKSVTHFTSFLALTFAACSTVSAQLIELDSSFGANTITRDRVQRLDFLDLDITANRSFDTVSALFGVGAEFEGFRYATDAEVVQLVNNFGFTPGASPERDINTIGALGDQVSGLLGAVGVTRQGTTFRQAIGIAVDSSNENDGSVSIVQITDFIENSSTTAPDSFLIEQRPNTLQSQRLGSFLVTAVPIPEPGSITFCTALCGMGILLRRKKQLVLSS